MMVILATAGGFGGHYDARPSSYTLSPDFAPKAGLATLLVALLAYWLWLRLRSLER
jgi:hypothetical protein